ncbi:hypothetical protein EV363DRAFT_1152173 [Boletus edulis]|nr:hypothetical protein EV363DRAFT_1152173 [Boletus edulis]
MRLTKVFHQKDHTFIEILASMRTGVLLKWHIEEFRKLSREIHYDDGISPTQLYVTRSLRGRIFVVYLFRFPLKAQVKQHNLQCLGKLEGETRVYKAMDARGHDSDGGRLTINQAETLLEKLVCPKEVPLKVGAQVMLLRNMSQSLVNGSLGKVVEFIGIPEAQRRDIAISELERRNTGEVLTVNSPDARDNEAGLIALDGHTFSKDQSWPLVQFTNGKQLLCSPVEFVVKGLTGEVEARRLQIPLALSWAMSIHKSQGQTFSRVKVDLARIFEKGQGDWVVSCMLSSLTTADAVSAVMAHPKVIEWQKQWDKDRYQEEEMDMLYSLTVKRSVEFFGQF